MIHDKKILLQIAEGAWNLVFRCDWRPIRFIMAFVLFGAAIVQYEFSQAAIKTPAISLLYLIAGVFSVIFGFFYLLVSTTDKRSHDENVATARYHVELACFAVWVLVFYVDMYAYYSGVLVMDAVSWQHHIIINFIVCVTLFLAYLNAVSIPEKIRIQKVVEKQYAEFTNNRHYSNG